MIAARVLGPTYYGAFAALMAMLLITGVLQLGLQATAARRIAAEPHHVGQIEQSILRVTYRASLALGALLLLASPLVNAAAAPRQPARRGPGRGGRRAELDHGRAGGHPPGRTALATARRWSISVSGSPGWSSAAP